ncbi:GMP/IMP nucleotidase [Spongiibacter sp. KMU-158]|uniref:GMP/IMP nucleotidase n=1 Tax=Spongiibacter pelagi TaxID=2760804 RepID=A0A927C1B9_9GAMM|nr:GMP/IMP nucleotidase [Spongiibacter pelagi]MBD2857695.1 GMP/IMP nucleotidase [Spongiibacter pelagi]
MLNWHDIDTVLLDMDGTILDLHYDNYFWTQHLPKRYSEIHGGELEAVTRHLLDKIMAQKGSLNWYCLDYWSRELQLDIPVLKREVAHLINPLPSSLRFLEALRGSHCESWLVTNAHQAGLDIKLEKFDLNNWLERIVTSHELAMPKEDPNFWQALQSRWHFDPERTLLVDDNIQVLDAARAFGIRHLITIRQPDSRQQAREQLPYPAILHFDELLPIPAKSQ